MLAVCSVIKSSRRDVLTCCQICREVLRTAIARNPKDSLTLFLDVGPCQAFCSDVFLSGYSTP